MPEVPEVDHVTAELLEAFSLISKGRRYVGMIGAPAPLSISDINDYLGRHPSAIGRDEFDAAIFALDEESMARWAEQNSQTT